MVGNHNIPASMSLKKIGVKAEKIFPWDWPHAHTPNQYAPKSLPHEGTPSIVFAGQLLESKGVADCIEAAALLKKKRVDFHWKFLGGGPFEDAAKERIQQLGLQDHVEVTGQRPHNDVIEAVKTATISVIPSHHAYPEGLPMAIYEALATRTPIIISDHPMFRMFFETTPAAIMVAEKSPARIAHAIKSLLSDPEKYAAASEATGVLWNSVKCDVTWGTLIERWIDSPRRPAQSIMRHSLEARCKKDAA